MENRYVGATARLHSHANAYLRSVADPILLTYITVSYSCCGHSGCRGCRGCRISRSHRSRCSRLSRCGRLGCSDCHGHQSHLDFFVQTSLSGLYRAEFIEQIPSIRFHRAVSVQQIPYALCVSRRIIGIALWHFSVGIVPF